MSDEIKEEGYLHPANYLALRKRIGVLERKVEARSNQVANAVQLFNEHCEEVEKRHKEDLEEREAVIMVLEEKLKVCRLKMGAKSYVETEKEGVQAS